MAALSPALSNSNNQKTVAVGGGGTPNPPKSQRGQNKPKCKQCGNVARSRCPYESCKSCCSRNQNPCHIHGNCFQNKFLGEKQDLNDYLRHNAGVPVLKPNSALPDKTPSSSAAPLDQQPVEPSQSTSASRVASLRQLSNSFAQFNNLNISLRSRKPLTRKDAAAINEWRFSKLKEYKERSIEVENKTFDRYMQNVDLLEEVLAVKSMEDNVISASESSTPSSENDNDMMITGLKLQLRSNSMRSDSVRIAIQQTVDRGLKKLKKAAVDGDNNDAFHEEPNNDLERVKSTRTDRLSAISDVVDKINKARTEEDLKSCLEMKYQVFNLNGGSGIVKQQDNETYENEIAQSDLASAKELDYSLPKLVGTAEIDQETLNIIDKHFSSLQHLEEL